MNNITLLQIIASWCALILVNCSQSHHNLTTLTMKRIDSLEILESDRMFTQVIIKSMSSVIECSVECLKNQTRSCLSVVYVEKNSNCSIILATSSIVNNKADGRYLDGDVYISYDYDKVMNSAKHYASTCLPEVPLPSSTFTLLQQHIDGCLNFTKVWTEYANGFGHPTGNYWAGLELMHSLTWPAGNRIRFEMKKFGDDTIYIAEYNSFRVGDSSDMYRLNISGYDSGVSTVGDSMITSDIRANLNNMQFSTTDQDNDGQSALSCSNYVFTGTGWWFNYCSHTNPNADYSDTRVMGSGTHRYMLWYRLDDLHAIKSIKMMIYN